MNIFQVISALLKDEAAKGQKLKVIARFVFAHIRFLSKKSFIFQWVHGIWIKAVHYRSSSTGCYYYGYYDPMEMRFIEKYLRQGDVFADVGSNVGSWALFAASLRVETYAIEPTPSTYKLLEENMKLNLNLKDKIIPIQCAVGDKRGSVDFTIDNDSENRVIETITNEVTQKVRCEKLDFICESLDAVKIDVENFEIPVLNGAKRLLKSERLNVIIIEAFDNYPKIDEILNGYGYKQYHYDYKTNIIKRCHGCENGNNILYIKNAPLYNF